MILLRQNLKGMQRSLNQWHYKLLQKLDHLLLEQQPGCGSPNGGTPLPSSSLAGQLYWPCREAGGSGAEGVGASGHGVEAQGAGSP